MIVQLNVPTYTTQNLLEQWDEWIDLLGSRTKVIVHFYLYKRRIVGSLVFCGHRLSACKDTICYIPGCRHLLCLALSATSMVSVSRMVRQSELATNSVHKTVYGLFVFFLRFSLVVV